MSLTRSPARRPPGRVAQRIAAVLATAILLLFSPGCVDDKDEPECSILIPLIMATLASENLTQLEKERTVMEYYYCKQGIVGGDVIQ